MDNGEIKEGFVTKPTNKNGAVVVWRTDLYILEAEHQLLDISSYIPLDHDPTIKHQMKGVAMGTHMGPSYAWLFVEYVEHSLFQTYS
eukprot:g43841.t1